MDLDQANRGAFPQVSDFRVEHGLTKRELIAAMTLQGLAAGHKGYSAERLAEWSVQHADALLAELAK